MTLARLVEMFGDPDGWCGVSASNVDRTIADPAWLALPHANETGEYAERGNIIHEFCRVVGKNPQARAQALQDIADDDIRATCEGIALGAVFDGIEVLGFEWAFVLNVATRTVRFLGENIHREYAKVAAEKGVPLGRYDVPMSIDVIGRAAGLPVELDYKTGRSVGPIDCHWQRRICSTALMLHFGSAEAISRLAYVRDDGSVWSDGHPFDLMDADDYCDTVKQAIDRVWKMREMMANGVMPPVKPSEDSCKYCPAIVYCPYHLNFAKAMLGDLVAAEKGINTETLTPEQWGQVWVMAKQAAKIAEAIEKSGKLIADTTPLIIDDEYEIRPKYLLGRSKFDAAKARGEIVKLAGRLSMSEEETDALLASLNVKGKGYSQYQKQKRVLPVIQQQEQINEGRVGE